MVFHAVLDKALYSHFALELIVFILAPKKLADGKYILDTIIILNIIHKSCANTPLSITIGNVL